MNNNETMFLNESHIVYFFLILHISALIRCSLFDYICIVITMVVVVGKYLKRSDWIFTF